LILLVAVVITIQHVHGVKLVMPVKGCNAKF